MKNAVNEAINALLADDDELVFEKITVTMITETVEDDDIYSKKGRKLLNAYQEGDVDAFCTALTGWTFEDILKKARAIEDTDGVFEDSDE